MGNAGHPAMIGVRPNYIECILYFLLHFETLVKCKMYPKSRQAAIKKHSDSSNRTLWSLASAQRPARSRLGAVPCLRC